VDDGGPAGDGGRLAVGRRVQVEAGRVGGNARLGQQPAPAIDLVLVVAPGDAAPSGPSEGDEPLRFGRLEDRRALGAAAVQVDGDLDARDSVANGVSRISSTAPLKRASGPSDAGTASTL
jgi:hypothetical protein